MTHPFADAPPSPPAPAGGPARPRLLVVDDQPANVQALYLVFAADHQVFVATSGAQALRLAREKRPDLVLLDVVMPDLDGLAVCARLKADPETAGIPVIFVTAHSDERAETAGLDAGAVDFISKPINPRIVRARVKTHLTLKQQADELRQLALVDALTGAHNRRRFDLTFGLEARRAARSGRPLSLLMVDVDHFKRFNDRYGHAAGDACLRRVVEALGEVASRPGDFVARYGGEEFACLLPETGFGGALAVAASALEHIRGLGIAHDAPEAGGRLSASIGVATTGTAFAGDADALFALADAQLYRAKAAGRDRVLGAVLETAPAAARGAP